jgi:hypothetical protein
MLQHHDVARVPPRLLQSLLALSHVLLQHRHHRAVARRFRVLQGTKAVLCVCVCVWGGECVCERKRERVSVCVRERECELRYETLQCVYVCIGMYIYF